MKLTIALSALAMALSVLALVITLGTLVATIRSSKLDSAWLKAWEEQREARLSALKPRERVSNDDLGSIPWTPEPRAPEKALRAPQSRPEP